MNDSRHDWLIVPGASAAQPRRIAYIHEPATASCGRGLVWLPGFKSDMISTKAAELAAWAKARGAGMTRFDYSGHGWSEGAFEAGTVSDWLDEAEAVFTGLTNGEQVLVGSSMGGWIATLLIRRLRERAPEHAARVAGAVLIAPAWDMTEKLMWEKFPPATRRELESNGVWYRPSAYGDEPYPLTLRLIEDGRRHLIADAPFDPGCPVRILHGMGDPDVPWRHGLALVDLLDTADVQLTLVKDGEHRLSRPQDLALLHRTVAALL